MIKLTKKNGDPKKTTKMSQKVYVVIFSWNSPDGASCVGTFSSKENATNAILEDMKQNYDEMNEDEPLDNAFLEEWSGHFFKEKPLMSAIINTWEFCEEMIRKWLKSHNQAKGFIEKSVFYLCESEIK